MIAYTRGQFRSRIEVAALALMFCAGMIGCSFVLSELLHGDHKRPAPVSSFRFVKVK